MTATLTYQSGGVPITGALTGTETVVVGNGGPQITTATTAQIAALAGSGTQSVNTAISTTAATGTLTAAAVAGRVITRTGPTQAFTDTFTTGALLTTQITDAFVGQSFDLTIKNNTAYAQTLSNATGFTASVISVVPAFMAARFLVTCTAANTWTAVGLELASINGTITDAILNGNAQCTTTLTAQTNTVVANITGMSVTVTGGATYNIRGRLNGVANTAVGIKVAMSGTATATSSNVTAKLYNSAATAPLVTMANQTTWGSNIIAITTTYTDIEFEGSIVVNAGGTVTVAAAQNVSSATSTTVLPGSFLTVDRVS